MENSSPVRTGPQPKAVAACAPSPVVARLWLAGGTTVAGAAAGAGAGAEVTAVAGVAAAEAGVWPLLEAVGAGDAAAEDAVAAAAEAGVADADARPAEDGADAPLVVGARPHPVRDKAPMVITVAIFLNKIPPGLGLEETTDALETMTSAESILGPLGRAGASRRRRGASGVQ